MKTTSRNGAIGWLVRLLAASLLCASASTAQAEVSDPDAAASLRATYSTLQQQLADNPFQRPLYLDSDQTRHTLRGDIHAVVEHPFATVGAQVRGAAQWCEIMMLHLNVKHCAMASGADGEILTARLGKKTEQPLARTHRVTFNYRIVASTPDYLQIRLDADRGPFGTSDYRIMLEAIPLEAGGTFVHLSYSYAYGPAAALAMRAYFSTAGSAKVGFTVVGRGGDGKLVHIGDLRGALERNTMRYFLAIDAYLGACSVPPQVQLERRLNDWFVATERYALQLRELDHGEYVAMKRNEYRRMLAQH